MAKTGRAPLWRPQPGPQTLAYDSPADVLGFGGSAGGGKSDVLLGLAVNCHERSVIFRREATQLRALVDRTREILGSQGRFNENTGVWRGLPGGRQIEFAGCKDPGDEQKHRGRPHSFIGFDEADQFNEFQVRFLMGWNRTATPGERCRVVLTFNPPGTAEGRWLLSFFGPWIDRKHPKPALPGELRWYATLPDGGEIEVEGGTPFTHPGRAGKSELITPRSRTFIPARVTDNAYLTNTGYIAVLQGMPEPLRSQLLYGDMEAGLEDDAWQCIPTAWVRAAQDRWRPDGGAHLPPTSVGVDVARGGKDKTVLAPRRGNWYAPLLKYPGTSTPEARPVVGFILPLLSERPDVPVHVDANGIGASVYDRLRELRDEGMPFLTPRAVIGSRRTDARDRAGVQMFTNLRSWMYWAFREALDPDRGDEVALPPDPELLADLCAPRWEARLNGIQVEPKERLTERLGRSPDCADAVVMASLPPSTWEQATFAPQAPRAERDPRGWAQQRGPRRRIFGR